MAEEQNQLLVSKRRWPIMIVFALYSLTSAFQWIQFSIIPSIFTTYYHVSLGAISWTSMIYMATFIPLVFPATWLIDNTGMRNVALIGAGMNAVGTIIKCCAIRPDLFWLVFIGQTISACAQCLILEMPPRIAAIWFPPDEVSIATSFGVSGNQLGVALGFIIPSLIIAGPVNSFRGISNEEDETFGGTFPNDWRNETHWNVTEAATNEVTTQIRLLFCPFAGICVMLFFVILFLFQDKPPKPANRAQMERDVIKTVLEEQRIDSPQERNTFANSVMEYLNSIARLLKSIPFVLLMISYGLNVGVFYSVSTLLNQIIKPTFFNSTQTYSEDFLASLDVKIGTMGTIMVFAGLIGALVGGVILDRYKKFKLTTLITCIFTLVFMMCFTWTVDKENMILNFCFIGILGFFMTGYVPIGMEFGAEITFPESEATSAGLLNCSAQIFGLAVTQLCQSIIEYYTRTSESEVAGGIIGGYYANITMICCLIVCLLLTVGIKEDLKRQTVENNF